MDSGDTAWMLMSTALVMIMLPGLALFYGGLVRSKNVLVHGHAQLLRPLASDRPGSQWSASRWRSDRTSTVAGLIGNLGLPAFFNNVGMSRSTPGSMR